MATYRISYNRVPNSAKAPQPEEVEAANVDHNGEWLVFKSASGQPILSVRERTVRRYERIGERDERVPVIA